MGSGTKVGKSSVTVSVPTCNIVDWATGVIAALTSLVLLVEDTTAMEGAVTLCGVRDATITSEVGRFGVISTLTVFGMGVFVPTCNGTEAGLPVTGSSLPHLWCIPPRY